MNRRDPYDEFAVLIRGETAAALGLAGGKLQQALAALAAYDHDEPGHRQQNRQQLVDEAAAALYSYVIQKELNGITDDETLKRSFDIPAEVWQRMGSVYAQPAGSPAARPERIIPNE